MSRTARIAVCAATLIFASAIAAAAEQDTGAPADTQAPAAPPASTAPAAADNGTAGNAPAHHAHGRKARESQEFVRKAALAGQTEIQAAQIAQSKSSSEDVKSFAQRMITDHTQANTKLADIASRDNLTVPTQLDARDKHELDRLNSASADTFDAKYARAAVRDHREAVELFRHAAGSGSPIDNDLRDFAKETLPTLKEHLQAARTLEAAHGRHTGAAQ